MKQFHANRNCTTFRLASLLTIAACCELCLGQVSFPSQSLTIPPAPTYQTPSDSSAAHGLSVSIHSSLLSKFVNKETVESDDVVTRVMEADVRGVQTTTTAINLRTVPSADVARFEIVATGVVNSDTVGYTPQAQVKTTGSHTFNVRKPVFFNGRQFSTKAAFGTLQARQFPQSVNSIASGVPLFGPIGNRFAWREVYRRMPTSDAIVVRRVADDVLPKVNAGVDRQLGALNRSMRTMQENLSRMLPGGQIHYSASTTDESLTIAARNPDVRLPVDRPLPANLQSQERASVLLAAPAVNEWLNAQNIGGLTISDSALQSIVTTVRESRASPAMILSAVKRAASSSFEPNLFSIRLATVNPVVVDFDKGQLILELRYQILPSAGDPGQMQCLTIGLKGSDAGSGQWEIALTDLDVAPNDSNETPDSWTTLIGNQLSVIADRIPPTRLPRTLDLSSISEKISPLRIHRIQTESGWVRISVRSPRDVQEVRRGSGI